MAVSLGLVQSLIELWSRRSEPEGADVPRALSITRSLESDEEAPAYIKAFSWHLTKTVHEAAGWEIPDNENLSRCRSAAASIRHSSELLLADIASEVVKSDDLVLVLGVVAASRSLFGRWDMLPAHGALLVSLVPPEDETTPVDALPDHKGVRWGSAGSKLGMLDRHSTTVQMNGCTVRVPNAELIAARTSGHMTDPADLETFLFADAAYDATQSGKWRYASRIAKRLGHEDSPRNAVLRLGLADWLGIDYPPPHQGPHKSHQPLPPLIPPTITNCELRIVIYRSTQSVGARCAGVLGMTLCGRLPMGPCTSSGPHNVNTGQPRGARGEIRRVETIESERTREELWSGRPGCIAGTEDWRFKIKLLHLCWKI